MYVRVGVGAGTRACSLIYPECNVPPPYCVRPLWLHQIFRLYLINGMVFGKNVNEHKMCVLIFSASVTCNNSHSKKN